MNASGVASRGGLEVALNAIGVLGLAGVLLVAFLFQVLLDELPCPLCLLQRVGVVATGAGLVLNLRFGSRPAHYGLVLAGALFGLAAAGRQVLLHIVPGSGAYGAPLLGIHLYTWCALLFLAAIAAVAVMLLIERPVETRDPMADSWAEAPAWVRAAVWALVLTTGLTALATFAECGPLECPDDPTSYWLLGD